MVWVSGVVSGLISMTLAPLCLAITGKKAADVADRKYLHRGIAKRDFERAYQLADYVRVDGAELKDGLLHVDLVREVPEATFWPIDTIGC